jgi:FkbM family methyltransferase
MRDDQPEHDYLRYYTPTKNYVEIGAYHGRTARLLAPDVLKILVEPSPPNADYIDALKIPNARVIRKAIWAYKGTAYFAVEGEDTENHLENSEYVREGLKPGYRTLVDTETLEGILDSSGWDEVELLAADCEGGEINLVRYAGRWLSEKKIKHLAIAAYHLSDGTNETTTRLRELGYEARYDFGEPPFSDAPVVYATLR